MNAVHRLWVWALVRRAALIQGMAFALVAVVDGVERAVGGQWQDWSTDVFRLHLVGLGVYVALAVLWTERDWRYGGEWKALGISGRNKLGLLRTTIITGLLWSPLGWALRLVWRDQGTGVACSGND